MSTYLGDTREWLEADGLGGFASGTVSSIRTRRYHALLLVATRPPAGRVVLVNDFDAWVETPSGTFPISTQRYPGGAIWPNGHQYLRELTAGVPGVQLTWMDAKVGDWVVTPRIGKPVEVQALWLNALHVATSIPARHPDGLDKCASWKLTATKGRTAFIERFWNDDGGYLYDVVDVDDQRGAVVPSKPGRSANSCGWSTTCCARQTSSPNHSIGRSA